MSNNGFILPSIPAEQMTPTVELLLAIIEQQQVTIRRLEERVAQLEAEVARLKKLPPRPKIKPSTLDKGPDDDEPPTGSGATGPSSHKGKRPGSKKRRKRLIRPISFQEADERLCTEQAIGHAPPPPPPYSPGEWRSTQMLIAHSS